MENLKNLLVYFMKNSPRILGRTDLMKYVYSFEYYYFQMKKEQFTETQFIRYHYGPNDQAVIDATLSLEAEGVLLISETLNYFGKTTYQHKLTDFSNLKYCHDLPEEAEMVACFIIDRLGKEPYQGVIDFAYDTPPMRIILQEEARIGEKINGRVLNMDQNEPVFKSTRQQKKEARDRLRSRTLPSTSDEEYYKHMIEQFNNYEDVRRRAYLGDNPTLCR
ncbi:winged helix-turn-helix domain-containing protein [Paenibacillus gallinarum]|uniref:Winged helix-turn-helix domain-containing protein n=1 Tax=Paenibacillus gallinarum TaxID=2762232 RepID=A0ABR8SW97_9BACL|nr:winged helix-turn-helix domain-containing protein [Paenibacillus gallinarum]MBD7967779.1 winged helix-turn-helix domain-containing protein [Paenibacillus gallinarum]